MLIIANKAFRASTDGYTVKDYRPGEQAELPTRVAAGLVAEGFARDPAAPEPTADELAEIEHAQATRAALAVNDPPPEPKPARKPAAKG